jgi:hypothetical protein
MERFNLAQHKGQWMTVVNAVMNLPVSWNVKNLFSS